MLHNVQKPKICSLALQHCTLKISCCIKGNVYTNVGLLHQRENFLPSLPCCTARARGFYASDFGIIPPRVYTSGTLK